MMKKRVISLVIVFTLLLSLFTVAFGESGTVYAWDDGSWKNSANDSWNEGDWIPVKVIPKVPDSTTTPEALTLTVGMEYTKGGAEPIGFDAGRDWTIGSNSATLNFTDLGISIEKDGPTLNGDVLQYAITVSSEALVELDGIEWALYGEVHASEAGTQNLYAGGIIGQGASSWSGKNLQVEYVEANQTVSFGINPALPKYGTIRIEKTVTGNMASDTDEFTFDIMDGDAVVDTVTASGAADGTSIDLLIGDYTVVERDPSPYTLEGNNNKTVTVEKDTESSVEFINDYTVPELGTIRIAKSVTGNAASDTDVFTFDIMDGDEVVDTVTASGETDGVSVELPVGNYTVVERDPSPYALVGNNNKPATVTWNGEYLVEFTNDRTVELPKYGTIRIEKTVTGNMASDTDEFIFDIMDGEVVVGTVTASGAEDGVSELLLTGDYIVVERDSSLYTIVGDNNKPVTVEENTESAVAFTNDYTVPELGTIRIAKTVTGNSASNDDLFTFDIMDGDEVIDTVTASGAEDGVSIELPVGAYKVVERDPSPYTLVGENNKPATVTWKGESLVEFTNDYTVPELGTIRIAKTVTGNAASDTVVFTFDIKDATGAVVDTVTASGEEDGISSSLLVGDYKVVERDPSPYTLVGENNKPATVTWNGETLVEFTNDRTVELPKYGTIRIEKTVTGNMASNTAEFTFDIMDGETIVDTVTASGATDGISSSLLVGDYTVVERDPSPYTLVGDNNKPVTVVEETESAVVFTNDYTITPTYILTIDKTVDDDTVYTNEDVTYTVVLENKGNQNLYIDFRDHDDYDIYEEYSFDLEAGATTSMAFTTSYSSTGEYTNLAEATYYDGQENPVTISDTATVDVNRRPSTSSTDYGLSITKTVDQDEVTVGDIVTYTITVKNIDEGNLYGVEVDDVLVGLDEEIDLPREGSEGDTVVYTIEYETTEVGILENTATAYNSRTGTKEASATVIVNDKPAQGLPGLAITKTVVGDKTEFFPGDIVEFKIVVTNTGTTTLENVLVDDAMAGYLDTIDVLKPGESADIYVNMTIPEGAEDFTNIAIATYDGMSATDDADVTIGVEFEEETVPLDVPDTGAIPMMLIYGLGALGVGTGWSIIDRKKR